MNNSQFWFRGVRSSKFRHVYGVAGKREGCYHNVPITRNAHDSQFCAANPKFVAVVTEVAGGGAFVVLPIDKTGRIDFNAFRVTGHQGPVLDIKWNPFNDNIIASCSDDCTIKLWYIPDDGLSCNLNECLKELHGHRRRVGYLEWHPIAENVLASAGFDYLVILWDVAKAEMLLTINCHTDIIHSLSFNRDGSRLATTSKDRKLRVINPRTGYVISENVCHESSRSSKVVYLSGGRLLTTGFSNHSDRQFAIWKEDNLQQPINRDTIDSSSGILFPYFDHDTQMLFLAGKGDGNIRYYEIVDDPPCIHFLNQYLSDSPQRGLGFMPKLGCDVKKCEVFRFYKLHTIKNICEPISMIVPRKSNRFQDDLYPNTLAPVPAVSASDWISGVNKQPILMPMKQDESTNVTKLKLNKSDESTKENNNCFKRKLAFLMEETVPDYRPLEELLTDNEKNQKTNVNQNRKFQQLQYKFKNYYNQDSNEDGYVSRISEKTNEAEIFKSEYQLEKAYNIQCDEIKLLRKQVANRDRRIQDLENLVTSLQSQISNLRIRQ